jgi:quercetin dioxygenase-like cupin family protein
MRTSSVLAGFVAGALVTACFGALALQMSNEATVQSFDKAEHRVAPTNKADVRVLAHGTKAFVGHLRMDPGAAVPEHRDASEEYIYVLQGAGRITIDDRAHDLIPGMAVFMPANAKVSFQNGDKEMVAIQVFAGPESAKKYAKWKRVQTPK